MKKFLLTLSLLLSLKAIAQKKIGLLCTNFKINNEIRDEGMSYRKSLESVLSNLKHPPLIIERENIPELLMKIQEESNLIRDLNTQSIPLLKAANVVFIMYANFDKKLVNTSYDLQLECVKISGENSFSKKIFPTLKFTEKEIVNPDQFRQKLNDLLKEYAFTEDFGIIENDQLEKISKRLDEKDIEIKNLKSNIVKIEVDATKKDQTIGSLSEIVSNMQKENLQKESEIKSLNKEVVGIKDYGNVANLDDLGVEKRYGDMFTGWKTDLYTLMEQVIFETKGMPIFNIKDSALLILDIVISKYPKFPFAYFAKSMILLKKGQTNWREFADKALDIFAITTTIEGHNKNHDTALKFLKSIIDYNNNWGVMPQLPDSLFRN